MAQMFYIEPKPEEVIIGSSFSLFSMAGETRPRKMDLPACQLLLFYRAMTIRICLKKKNKNKKKTRKTERRKITRSGKL